MNPYCNLPPEQRRVQQLVALFNADERLWRSLEGKRRLRRQAAEEIIRKCEAARLEPV
jgi:hypothetical protein